MGCWVIRFNDIHIREIFWDGWLGMNVYLMKIMTVHTTDDDDEMLSGNRTRLTHILQNDNFSISSWMSLARL